MASNDNLLFHRRDLPHVCFSSFKDMRAKDELCDLIVKVQNHAFAAHRVILAAGIPYFRTIFKRSGSKTQQKEIVMDNLDPMAVESLIHYTYTSRINVSKDNVLSLLQASEFLNINEVKNVCVQFLSERLHYENVIEVRELAVICNNSTLAENCTSYMKKCFEEICKTNNFLSLPYECIQEIISADDLSVSSEKVVFEAVIRWVKYSPLKRQGFLHRLLSEVRLINIPISYLTKKAVSEELIALSAPCKELLSRARNYSLLSTEDTSRLNLNTKQRTKYIKNTIYTVCQSQQACSAYVCDFTKETWHHLSSKQTNNKCIYGSAAVDDIIYIFLENTIEKFHPRTGEWVTLQTNHENIDGAAILPHGTVIYCFGIMKSIFESAVHSFDTRQNKWLPERKMMACHSSAAVSLGNFIYITGGVRNFSGHTETAKKYNPLTNTWWPIAPMLAPRAAHNCAVINDKIYACGGTTDLNYTDTAEVYNTVTNQWNSIASMFARRSRFSLISYNNKLYAFGGYDETVKDSLQTEIYDPESNRWVASFSVPHGFRSALLIFIPRN